MSLTAVFIVIIVLTVLAILAVVICYGRAENIDKRKAQAALLEYRIPTLVLEVFRRDNPTLSADHQDLAFQGLREYFMLMLLDQQRGIRRSLAMPSTLVDDAWHAFMLCSAEYERFCRKCFGKMIHHTPNPSSQPGQVPSHTRFKSDVLNTWASYRDNKKAHPEFFPDDSPVPLLFRADSQSGRQNGWVWSMAALDALDAQAPRVGDAGGATTTSGSGCSSSQGLMPDLGVDAGGGGCGGTAGGDCSGGSDSGGSSCGSSCSSGCGGD